MPSFSTIMTVFTFALAAAASPMNINARRAAELTARNEPTCTTGELKCCSSITPLTLIGLGCVPILDILDCNEQTACCSQGGTGINVNVCQVL